ncbi:TetR/AcrR family transcriptional regulator [Neobacillus soli]|uniref:TetR/AcrR family transcriptional regulator n=1 Tax=Neobacillus soli TaxID=220688 RepID=UPI00082695DC|nr:TetR-like C-terminal domain-containing protein [Neobacillus soli]
MEIKDPRQILSIKKLQKAYLSLLLQENENMSIQRLCQEAQVTRPTFYNLYKDLMDLRIHLYNSILEELRKSLTITNPKKLEDIEPEELPENMIFLFEHILQNHLAYEVLFIYKPDALFMEEVKLIICQYIEDGICASQSTEKDYRMEIPFIISYTTGAYLESIFWWIKNNYKYTPEIMAAKLLEISLYGPYKNVINWKKQGN